MAIIIGRPIEGIGLNGLEYLMDENNSEEYKQFNTRKEAEDFLRENGIDDEYHEDYWFKNYNSQTKEIYDES